MGMEKYLPGLYSVGPSPSAKLGRDAYLLATERLRWWEIAALLREEHTGVLIRLAQMYALKFKKTRHGQALPWPPPPQRTPGYDAIKHLLGVA